jgi:hypothetical protein
VSGDRDLLVHALRDISEQWRLAGSLFNAVFLSRLADDVEAGGIASELLGGIDEPASSLPGVRLLGGVHRLVLTGQLPGLARHYPSVGGDGDVDAAWGELRRALVEHAAELRPDLAHPPQTNEVGRAAALASGMLLVTHETRLPLRLLEVGASAGLNLRVDHYWYETNGRGAGDPDSPVRFVEPWEGNVPPLDPGLTVASRRGCDANPVDPTTAEGRLTLSSWIPPDQPARFARLQAALDVAARVPATVDAADIADWLEAHVAPLPEGHATVVFHSIVWQYLDGPTDARARAAIEGAGSSATAKRPLAWLALEAPVDSGDYMNSEVRLRMWPGGEERLIALTPPHGPPVRWLV